MVSLHQRLRGQTASRGRFCIRRRHRVMYSYLYVTYSVSKIANKYKYCMNSWDPWLSFFQENPPAGVPRGEGPAAQPGKLRVQPRQRVHMRGARPGALSGLWTSTGGNDWQGAKEVVGAVTRWLRGVGYVRDCDCWWMTSDLFFSVRVKKFKHYDRLWTLYTM